MAQNCVVLEGKGRKFTEYFGELYKTLNGKEEAGVINLLPKIFHPDAVTDRIKKQLKLESFESDFYTEMRASPPTTKIIIKTLGTIATLLKDANDEETTYLQELQNNIQLYQKWAEFR